MINNEYYYEDNYPDCIGEEFEYGRQPGCLTCIYKGDCLKQIEEEIAMTEWEAKYEYSY